MKHHNSNSNDKNLFIIASVVFIFGLVWAMIGEEWTKVVFATISFGFFIYAGVKLELNAIHSKKAH